MRRFVLGLVVVFVIATGIGVGLGTREANAWYDTVCWINGPYFCCSSQQGGWSWCVLGGG